MAVELTDAQRARLAARLPDGYDVNALRFVETEVQIQSATTLTADEEAALATLASEASTAAPRMINTDGRPTILKVVQWMCHADVVNKNGDMFVREELEAIAPGLFRAPNFGVMDWNHGAILQWNDDPALMGVWYGADWAFDQRANNGAGAWGILVKGMMFAWLFPEQADALIAEQVRSGSVKGSMACIPASVEFRDVDGQMAAVLHNPVFFTHSLLDKPPADPDAAGLVSEDPSVTLDELHRQVVASGSTSTATAGSTSALNFVLTTTNDGITWANPGYDWSYGTITVPYQWVPATHGNLIIRPAVPAADSQESDAMDELKQALELAQAKLEAAELKLQTLEPKVTELEGANATLTEQAATAAQTIADLTVKVTELETAREALVAQCEAATAVIAERDTTIASLTEELSGFTAAEAARAQAAVLAARIAALPEEFRKAHAKKDEAKRKEVEARWAKKTDEEWAEYVEDLLGYVPTKVGFVQLSEQEGRLPQPASESTIVADLKSLLK